MKSYSHKICRGGFEVGCCHSKATVSRLRGCDMWQLTSGKIHFSIFWSSVYQMFVLMTQFSRTLEIILRNPLILYIKKPR